MAYKKEAHRPALRPEWIKKMKRVAKQKAIKIGSMKEFRKRYGLDNLSVK